MMTSNTRHIIIWLLIIIMVLVIMIGAIKKKNHSLENFTPRLGQFYRPFTRRARIFGEGFYNRTKQNITNLIRSNF